MIAIIATWSFGLKAVRAGWKVLENGGSAVDAVEAAIREVEEDTSIRSVGIGGYPNIEGTIELDAAIMDGSNLNAGAVAAVRNVVHPISLARKVMEETPHVMVVGEGAVKLAKHFGLYKENIRLQEEVEKEWKDFLLSSAKQKPEKRKLEYWAKIIYEQRIHDTIGCVALDKEGRIAAGTSTSGLKFKLVGRVGDSPIIGAGLYANEFGGAAATGLGENIIVHNVARLVVSYIENGYSAEDAARMAVERILKTKKKTESIAFVALDKDGRFGAAATHEGFEYAVMNESLGEPKLYKGTSFKLI